MKNYLKQTALFFLLLLQGYSAYSQTPANIDSLVIASQLEENDTIRLKQLGDIIKYYQRRDLNKSQDYAKERLALAIDIGDQLTIGKSYYWIANIYTMMGKADSALVYFPIAAEKFKESNFPKGEGVCWTKMGYVHWRTPDNEKAVECFKESYSIAKSAGLDGNQGDALLAIGQLEMMNGNLTGALRNIEASAVHYKSADLPKLLATALGKIGNVHKELGDLTEARRYFQDAIDLSLDIDYKHMAAVNYNVLGQSYIDTKDENLELAKTYLKKGEAIRKSEGALTQEERIHTAGIYGALSRLYLKSKDPSRAVIYLNKQDSLDQLMNSKLRRCFTLINWGRYYNLIKSPHEAIESADKAHNLARELDEMQARLESLDIKLAAYNSLGNYRLAYDNLSEYASLRDSFLTSDKQVELASIKAEYQYKEEKLTDSLQHIQEKLILSNKVKKEKRGRILFIALSLLLSLLAFSLINNIRQKKRSNLLLEEKNSTIQLKSQQNETLLKEIHHRVKNNLQTISSLLYLQSANITDVDAKEAITQGQHRVESMALIHKNLYMRDNLAGIEMKDYLTRLVNNLKESYTSPGQEVEVNINMPTAEVNVDTAIPLGLITNELLTNAFKYAFANNKNGKIDITFSTKSNSDFFLKISDNGIGNRKESKGFGSQLISLLVKQLGAHIEDGNKNGYWVEIYTGNHTTLST